MDAKNYQLVSRPTNATYAIEHRLWNKKGNIRVEYLRKSDGTFGQVSDKSDIRQFINYNHAMAYLIDHDLHASTSIFNSFSTYEVVDFDTIALDSNSKLSLTEMPSVKKSSEAFAKLVASSKQSNLLAIDFKFSNGTLLKVAGAMPQNKQFKTAIFDPDSMTTSDQLAFLRDYKGSFIQALKTNNANVLQKALTSWIENNHIKEVVCWLSKTEYAQLVKDGWIKCLDNAKIINLAPIMRQYEHFDSVKDLMSLLNIKISGDADLELASGLIRICQIYSDVYMQNCIDESIHNEVTILEGHTSEQLKALNKSVLDKDFHALTKQKDTNLLPRKNNDTNDFFGDDLF